MLAEKKDLTLRLVVPGRSQLETNARGLAAPARFERHSRSAADAQWRVAIHQLDLSRGPDTATSTSGGPHLLMYAAVPELRRVRQGTTLPSSQSWLMCSSNWLILTGASRVPK
eukprot:scaffold301810_cov37-Tisochrysis_lutea.AAC.1